MHVKMDWMCGIGVELEGRGCIHHVRSPRPLLPAGAGMAALCFTFSQLSLSTLYCSRLCVFFQQRRCALALG